MPSVPVQRRVKRVIIKKKQRLGSHPKTKPFNPLCGKLKSNNNLLAKALSDQKQENQNLFSQNVALNAQVHSLGVACNKRDAALANVEKNAKEILNMLVTMTNFVTNTIITCQGISNQQDIASRASTSSAARRESTRRLSTKSPARGVVKPMVSGHTITRPTINLSRINMQHVNNLANLSIIDETPPAPATSPTISEDRTPPSASTRVSYEGRRGRRLPERIPLGLLRVDDDEEGRLSRQNSRLSGRFSGNNSNRLSGNHSGRLSGSNSGRISGRKSGGLSNGHVARLSENALIQLRSPRVALKDVSKLLRNSQTTINIRTLEQDSNDEDDEEAVEDNAAHIEPSEITLQAQVISEPSEQESEISPRIRNDEVPNTARFFFQQKNKNQVNDKINQNNRNDSSTWEDPMEGPSWLLNHQANSFSEDEFDADDTLLASIKNTPSKRETSNVPTQSGTVFPFNPAMVSPRETILDETMEFTECVNIARKANDGTFRTARNGNDRGEDVTVNLTKRFVTTRRGGRVEDDMDDDTMMLGTRMPVRNMPFDISELRLPVLEGPIVPHTEPEVEPEPEVTTTICRLTHHHLVPVPNASPERSFLEHSSLQLPLIPGSARMTSKISPAKMKRLNSQTRKRKVNYNLNDSDSEPEQQITPKKKVVKKKKPATDKDPSSAKVVLQKLNDTHVRRRTPTPEPSHIQEVNHTTSAVSSRCWNSRESDESNSSCSMNSTLETNRPRRQKAPISLKEPSLNKKLRRDC